MRRWLALAAVAACHASSPPPRAPAAPAGCKVAEAVCDPAVDDATALAVVGQRCAGCHADGGRAAHPLLTLDALRADRANVALRVAGCEMPPEGPPLPAGERNQLVGWAACLPGDFRPSAGTKPRADR
jgi:hypothetical protein